MDSQVREKETSIAKVRESGQERERALQGTIRDLNKQLEDLQGVLRQSQWKQQDVQKENEATIKRYQKFLGIFIERSSCFLKLMMLQTFSRFHMPTDKLKTLYIRDHFCYYS